MQKSSGLYCISGLADGVDHEVGRLEIGPEHPCNSGHLEFELTTDDEVVYSIDVAPGALHRGVEYILETRDYRQALSLLNRHDWQAPLFGELSLAELVERELGIEIPARAQWIRTLLAEQFRILSHLAFLSFVGYRLGRDDLATGALREQLRTLNAELTGNRLHPMAIQLGGVSVDPSPEWAADERRAVAAASELAGRLLEALASTRLGDGIAVTTPTHIAQFGLSGLVARAAGVPEDLRVSEPTAPYAALCDLITPSDAPASGDALARFTWLAAEVQRCAELVTACLDALPAGELAVRLPQVVKLPDGDAYHEVEAPLGRAGIWLVSRGDKVPWRLRLRTPSLANVSAWTAVIPGTPVDALAVAVASLPYVTGDLAK